MVINGLILAAGMSSRMGQFKPLMQIEEKTVIETTVDHMLDAGVAQIMIVLGYRGSEIKELLEKNPKRSCHLKFAFNLEYETTQMLDSIKVGLDKMGICDRFFIAPGDMPAITTKTYQTLIEMAEVQSESKILFPTVEGYRKHPPLISWECRESILQFQGNGLRELWKEYDADIVEIPLEDNGCTMDVDTPEDYQKLCQYLDEKKVKFKETNNAESKKS